MLATWSIRAMVGAGLALVILATVEVTLADHQLLPNPLNVITFLLLVSGFILAGSCRMTAALLDRHDRHDARDGDLRQWLELQFADSEQRLELASDLRYTRLIAGVSTLNHQVGDVDKRLREIEALMEEREAPTVAIPRLQLVAAVGRAPVDETALPGYARGYVDGLARQPMDSEAKVLPFERN